MTGLDLNIFINFFSTYRAIDVHGLGASIRFIKGNYLFPKLILPGHMTLVDFYHFFAVSENLSLNI
jgi:hypothetical protein